MNKYPLISIIMPVYNVKRYIRRSIESVISQTYYNLEIIIVDDGSIDGSGKICDQYAQKDKRIKVLHKKNQGLSEARNEGIKVASAEYIAFIDSDDYVCSLYIQHLVQTLLLYEADIAICGYWHGKREQFPRRKVYHAMVQCYDSDQMLEQWHGRFKHIETPAWNKLYKKKLFVENHIFFPAGHAYEDTQTTHLLVSKAHKIAITNEKLYYYYKRKGSIMNTVSENMIKNCIYAQDVRLNFFMNNGYQEAYERLAIKRQKQYILDYFKTMKKDTLIDVNNELLYLYNKNCLDVCHFATTNIVEFILFYIFRYGVSQQVGR